MKILKFGGTSVGSAHGLSCIKNIVESQKGSLVVVVSALGGVTDQLLRIADMAQSQSQDYISELQNLKTRHIECVEQSVAMDHRKRAMDGISPLLDELEAILKGVSLVGELSARSSAMVVSYGERLSSIIVHCMLEGSFHLDSRTIFKTRDYFNRYIIDFPQTIPLIRSSLCYMDSDCCRTVTVMGGFISSDSATGRTTNLGRGGSDYTAALLAGVLDARLLEIYTDVDGFMTADPRIVPKARLIKTLDFVEAMELCNYGAKVLYPPTIFPTYNNNIPIVIKNTFNHTCAGTFIDSHALKNGSLAGVSSIKDTALITIEAPSSGNISGRSGTRWLSYRLYRALARAGIAPFFQSVSTLGNLSIGVAAGDTAHKAMDILLGEFSQEIAMSQIQRPVIRHNLATVALIGTSIPLQIRTQVMASMQQASIEVIATNPESDNNVALVLNRTDMDQSIRLIHTMFMEKEHIHINLHIKGCPELESYIIDHNDSLVQEQNRRFVVSTDQNQAHLMVDCMRDSVVRVGDDMSLAMGVKPIIKQVLDSFAQSGDKPTAIKAVIPAQSLQVARFRAKLMCQWVDITQCDIVDCGTFDEQTQFVGLTIQNGICTIEPIAQHNTKPYMAISSARFQKYPLQIWLEKLDINAIYLLILQLSDFIK